MFEQIITLIFIFTSVIVLFYLYRKLWVHCYFKRLGIPGPEPHWIFGNLLALADESRRHLQYAEWTSKYGSIYGIFEGPSPVLMISDIDAIHNVFIKQFSTFHARKLYHYQPDPDDPNEAVSVFFARGDRWKRLRTIVNPSFSTRKMREMTPRMKEYQKSFLNLVEKKRHNGPMNIYDMFQLLTIDTIGECAFGIELNSVKTEGRANPTLKRIQEMLQNTVKVPLVLLITTVLTELKPLLNIYVQLGRKLRFGMLSADVWIFDTVRKIVTGRKTNPATRHDDMLQLMLDGDEVAGGQIVNEKTATTLSKGGHILKALTLEEIEAQVYIFLVAGYETTSNVLAYVTYELALHGDKQDRLVQELNSAFGRQVQDCDIGYDGVSAKNLPYLDAVVNETLRKYPVGIFVVNRIAMEETNLMGYRIPKDLPVQAEVWSVQHDPDIWGPMDTSEFIPERWIESEDNVIDHQRRDVAFLAFGCGPRTCIGMRFAQLELKITLVNLLRKYKLERCSETEVPLKLKVAFTMAPQNGIWVTCKPREKIEN